MFKKILTLALALVFSLLALSSCMEALPFGPSQTQKPDDNKAPAEKSEYTVTFDTQGGTTIKSLVVKPDEKIFAPATPIKLGAEFDHWSYNGREWNFSKDTVKRDITLVAKWKLISYNITYDLGGGSYSGSMPKTYTVEDTISLGTPTRPYSEFLGWEIDGKKATEIPKGTTGDINVVATWFGLEAEITSAKGGADGIVAFIHDDARLGTMEIFDGLLEKYGMVGDVGFYLKGTGVINSDGTTNTEKVNLYKEYIDNGRWKIVNHSHTHTWWGSVVNNIPQESSALITYEFITSQQKMRELFPGQRVLTYAYPGFSYLDSYNTNGNPNYLKDTVYSANVRRLVDTHYISARRYDGGPTLIGDKSIDWSWTNAQFLTASYIANTLDGVLANTVKDGLINILSFHGVTNDETEYNSELGYYLYGSELEAAMQKVDAYVKEGKIWNTHYEDAILYVREAETAKVELEKSGDNILLTLTDGLDDKIYDAALTLRLKNYGDFEAAKISCEGMDDIYVVPTEKNGETYLQFDLVPDKGQVTISPITLADIPTDNQ